MPERDSHTLLLVDNESDFLEWAERHLAAPGVRIVTETDPAKAIAFFRAERPDLVIAEFHLQGSSGMEVLKHIRSIDPNAMVVLTTGFPTTSAVIESMKLGAYDFLGKESLVYELRPVVEGALKARDEILAAAPEPAGGAAAEAGAAQETIIGKSPAMQDVFKLIGRVSRSEAPVMITGESGVGKEVVASAIHRFSPRARREFVAINCAAIPENLLESELFGHEKGAFTGATVRRAGRFEQCDGGTLFLDEIGDMPIQTQSKILRVLQEGEFSRVGGNETIRTDVRILAATNKDLEKEVDEGRFREDLFYRLNVVRIHLPPLRQRREDIPLLADFFLQRIAKKKNLARLRLSEDAVRLLVGYDWPGNVRELENTIQRACALATTDVLLPKDIPLGRVPRNSSIAYRVGSHFQSAGAGAPQGGGDDAADADGRTVGEGTAPEASASANGKRRAAAPPDATSGGALAEGTLDDAVEVLLRAAESDPEMKLLPWLEREMTRHAMNRTANNQVQAAKLLGITRATLRKRLETFGISKK